MAECLMYGVDLESRCLADVPAAEDNVTFLIGTQNIKMDNQICRVELDGSRIVARSFTHSHGEVRALSSDPALSSRFITAASNFRTITPHHTLNLFEMAPEGDLLQEVHSKETGIDCIGLDWESRSNRVASLSGNEVVVLDMEKPFETTWRKRVEGAAAAPVWSPHNQANILGLPVDRDLIAFDARTNESVFRIADAHSLRTTFLDFNPNSQFRIASCGRDGAIRIWDWRKANSPLFSLRPHAHWAWQVHFHPVHDQLLLSAGSDACLVLSSAYSVSSEAEVGQEEEDEEERDGMSAASLGDSQLERIEEHEESVYACVWSSADPWTFASLSFDGRILISHVNRDHKYALMRL